MNGSSATAMAWRTDLPQLASYRVVGTFACPREDDDGAAIIFHAQLVSGSLPCNESNSFEYVKVSYSSISVGVCSAKHTSMTDYFTTPLVDPDGCSESEGGLRVLDIAISHTTRVGTKSQAYLSVDTFIIYPSSTEYYQNRQVVLVYTPMDETGESWFDGMPLEGSVGVLGKGSWDSIWVEPLDSSTFPVRERPCVPDGFDLLISANIHHVL